MAMYWWEHLQMLRDEEAPSPADLVARLEAASKAVCVDAVWESSGIERMLQKARAKAAVCSEAARVEALELLSFHLQRSALVSGTSGSSGSGDLPELGKLSSGSTSPSSDEDAAQPDAAVQLDSAGGTVGSSAKRQRTEAGSSATSVDHSFSAPSYKCPRAEQGEDEFAVPRRKIAHQVQRATPNLMSSSGSSRLKSITPAPSASLSSDQQQQNWQGSMHLHLEDFSSSELCHAQVQMPRGVSRHVLPPRLVFTHIVQRRGVTLGKHQVCRTIVSRATPEQAQSLRSMAVNELVAVSSQGSTAFILVPYLDSKQAVKVAGFLLQF